MSCNGCRALRKGCMENCIIRPCLEWIKNPEAQANATFFLAKFYGRAGLLNLISSGPVVLRPAIFRSLLYEACGRSVNPSYGSIGLLCTGNWNLCEAAVQAVLASGTPVAHLPSGLAPYGGSAPPLKDCDIRHHANKAAKTRAGEPQEAAKAGPARFKRPADAHVRLIFESGRFPSPPRDHGRLWQVKIEEAADMSLQAGPSTSAANGAEDAEMAEMEIDLTLSLKPPGSNAV